MALLNVNPGDVLGVPARSGGAWGFVLARIIRSDPSPWLEVFGDFSRDFSITEEEVLNRDFSISNRLFNPVYVALDFNRHFGEVKWPILARNPGYSPGQSAAEEIEFEEVSYWKTGVYYRNGIRCQELPGHRRDLEDATIYSNPQLVWRINLYLSGYFAKGAAWNSRLKKSVIEKEGVDWWVGGINACNANMDTIALEFKKVRRGRRS